jgi:hypothetical protein
MRSLRDEFAQQPIHHLREDRAMGGQLRPEHIRNGRVDREPGCEEPGDQIAGIRPVQRIPQRRQRVAVFQAHAGRF